MRQKRSIRRNIELPVAIHEVLDGQRSGFLRSLLRLTRKRNLREKPWGRGWCHRVTDKERLYLDSHFKSVFLFLFSLAFSLAF